jgi:rod shape determining protein RodA
MWFTVSLVIAIIILFFDSKFFTATAYLQYLFGTILLLLVFVIGKKVNGSRSWIAMGGFQLQPAEFMKIFTSLALAKFLSSPETQFTKFKHMLIGIGISLFPAVIILAQNETGVALVYFSLFVVMYREGLPEWVLILGFGLIILMLSALLINKTVLLVIFTVLALLVIFALKRRLKRNKGLLFLILLIYAFCSLFVATIIPYTFKHILKNYQVERIYNLLGKESPVASTRSKKDSNYNVQQSKIAIGSGGLAGKGYLQGTQTKYDFVPAQRTDFIFCTIGEEFGFVGSVILLSLYLWLLLRIIKIAERQRSTFSRVYAYGVASIMFFHIIINLGMTLGIMPVIGIPLPLLSYGGSSLLSFTMLLAILLKLDSDRLANLR